MEAVPEEMSATLPGEPASVGQARRLIATAMTDSGHAEIADVAILLVSEVVTNSVLHAGTDIHLRCRPSSAGVRVEVSDGSPVMPTVRHYDTEATTGRGLALVSALATCWGVDDGGHGKTLWFELHAGAEPEDVSPSGGESVAPVDGAPAALEVHLLGAPPSLVLVTVQQGDALLRELALQALGGEIDEALPEGWQVPQFDVAPVLAAAEAAEAEGMAKADLTVCLAPGAETAALDRLRLVDHADRLAREDRLLSAPALPEVAACRHWIYSQIAEQAAGFPPLPWALPEPLEPTRVAASLPDHQIARLNQATVATVVADDSNRIVFVNAAAGEMLHWTPDALVGQRLTVLIPPELREAHLAGFSRIQVTGAPRILGIAVRVPALRRDGRRVDVTLLIDELAGLRGRRLFRGVLRRDGDADGGGPAFDLPV